MLHVVPFSEKLGSRERAAYGQNLRGGRARIREGRSGMCPEGTRLARTRRGDRLLRRLGTLQGRVHGRCRRTRTKGGREVATLLPWRRRGVLTCCTNDGRACGPPRSGLSDSR